MRVCPDCGHDTFTTEHPAMIRRERQVTDEGYVQDGEDEVMDFDRDYDALKCADCGELWQEDELVTEEVYSAGDCQECGTKLTARDIQEGPTERCESCIDNGYGAEN